MFTELHADELNRIREWCATHETFSWTSLQYQNDILNFVYENRHQGDCVLEVGCYKGGLTSLLAVVCKHTGLHLRSMDIWDQAVASANNVLSGVGFSNYVTVEHVTLPNFVRKSDFPGKPVLCILDGDHAYSAVIADIKAATSLTSTPYAIAFHDYSLRHPTTDERVSDAIDDHFGALKQRTFIGQKMNGAGHATKEAPQPDGHWWEVPGYEGAIVTLR